MLDLGKSDHDKTVDEDTFAQLLWSQCQSLRQFLRYQASHLSEADRDDILQETITAAWLKHAECDFPNLDAFNGWLSTIAKRKVLDHIRNGKCQKRGGAFQRVGVPAVGASSIQLQNILRDGRRTPSSEICARELAGMVVGLVDQLPVKYRTVIRFRYIEGLSVSSIADRMECDRKSVYNLLFRAMNRLRKIMDG